MANDKLDAFMKKQKDFAQDFQDNQKSVGTEPLLKDVTAAFHKGRNEVKIGERTYVIKKFKMRDLLKISGSVMHSSIAPISECFSDASVGEDVSSISRGLYLLAQSMGSGEFTNMVEMLLSETTLEGQDIDIDDFDDFSYVVEAVTEVLKVNLSLFTKSLVSAEMIPWLNRLVALQD